MTGIPAIPAIFIVANLIMGAPANGSDHAFVNMSYFTIPMPVIVHGVAGIFFFLFMPFQFSSVLRKKYTRYHRLAGAIVITSGITIACSAPWMHHAFSSEASLARYVGLLSMSVCIVISFSIALKAITQANIEKHRIWMVRSIAITLGPITAALFEIPIFLILNSFNQLTPEMIQFVSNYDRLYGMSINLAIVEYLRMRKINK